MSTTLIVNAQVVNEDEVTAQDVFIDAHGRIDAIGKDLSSRQAGHVVDATGLHLLPGMIDDQVHFREPGFPGKANMATESAAAVAGGITSFMDMPNTIPNVVNISTLEEKYRLAKDRVWANYSFYMGASNDNLEEIQKVDPNAVCGLKIFMGASTGNMLVDNPEVLDRIFANAPTLIATHCEDTPMINAAQQRFTAQFGNALTAEHHPLIRSREACIKSTQLAVELASKHRARLHVLHITTAEEALGFMSGPYQDKHITAEACVHFLHFDSDDYPVKGNLIKCNPSIKLPTDKAAIIQALQEDRLDVIATDHAPHTWDEKQQAYDKAPAGLPLVQHAMLVVLEKYHSGLFDLPFIVRKTSHAVADIFQIKDRGYLREGYWADLVLVDLNKPFSATHENSLSKCGWTPFDGHTFASSIHSTFVNGQCVYKEGQVQGRPQGQRMYFNRV